MVKTTDLVADLRICRHGGCSACGHDCGTAECIDHVIEDAADNIEELVDRCARYAEEIAVLREKVVLSPTGDGGIYPAEGFCWERAFDYLKARTDSGLKPSEVRELWDYLRRYCSGVQTCFRNSLRKCGVKQECRR